MSHLRAHDHPVLDCQACQDRQQDRDLLRAEIARLKAELEAAQASALRNHNLASEAFQQRKAAERRRAEMERAVEESERLRKQRDLALNVVNALAALLDPEDNLIGINPGPEADDIQRAFDECQSGFAALMKAAPQIAGEAKSVVQCPRCDFDPANIICASCGQSFDVPVPAPSAAEGTRPCDGNHAFPVCGDRQCWRKPCETCGDMGVVPPIGGNFETATDINPCPSCRPAASGEAN